MKIKKTIAKMKEEDLTNFNQSMELITKTNGDKTLENLFKIALKSKIRLKTCELVTSLIYNIQQNHKNDDDKYESLKELIMYEISKTPSHEFGYSYKIEYLADLLDILLKKDKKESV